MQTKSKPFTEFLHTIPSKKTKTQHQPKQQDTGLETRMMVSELNPNPQPLDLHTWHLTSFQVFWPCNLKVYDWTLSSCWHLCAKHVQHIKQHWGWACTVKLSLKHQRVHSSHCMWCNCPFLYKSNLKKSNQFFWVWRTRTGLFMSL